MATSPLPGIPNAPVGTPMGPSAMLPQQPPPQQQQPQPPQQPQYDDAQARMNGFLNMVQTVHQMVDDTARQFPEAAEGSREVKDAIENWIMQVVRSPLSAGTEPVPPRIVG